jgi:outer membrane lipoprotein-sorting protein
MMIKFLLPLLCAVPLLAHAEASSKLESFVSATHSVEANFTQKVMDRSGHTLQQLSGYMQFVRPNKFRWSYQKPYQQLIVGDGERFWLYDADLNQVTEKKLGDALGSSPAALLSGSSQIEQEFALRNIKCQEARGGADHRACKDGVDVEGLEWLEAIPRAQDSSIDKMRLAFNAQSDLVMMALFDSLGHVTVLRFSNLKRNPSLAPQLFKFEPPRGADVLSN